MPHHNRTMRGRLVDSFNMVETSNGQRVLWVRDFNYTAGRYAQSLRSCKFAITDSTKETTLGNFVPLRHSKSGGLEDKPVTSIMVIEASFYLLYGIGGGPQRSHCTWFQVNGPDRNALVERTRRAHASYMRLHSASPSFLIRRHDIAGTPLTHRWRRRASPAMSQLWWQELRVHAL